MPTKVGATKDEEFRRRYNAYRKKWRERPEVVVRERDKYLRKRYGISSAEYERKLEEQGGCCAICRKKLLVGKQKFLHVDHMKGTPIVRGILCQHCNTGLGSFFDDPDLLKAASRYLLEAEELRSF